MSLSALQSCASCTEQAAATLYCARYRLDYCSRACQKTDWDTGGHKKAWVGAAPVGALRRGPRGAVARARSPRAHELRCAGRRALPIPSRRGQRRWHALFGGPRAGGPSGGRTWGASSSSRRPRQTPAGPPGQKTFAVWASCSACKQEFTGQVKLRVAVALWAKHARTVETDDKRLLRWGSTPQRSGFMTGELAGAARLERGILYVETRILGPDHN